MGIPVDQQGVSRPVTTLTESHVQDMEKAQSMSIITAQQGMLSVVSVTKEDTTKLCVEQASLERYNR